jgi:hypothetical protein
VAAAVRRLFTGESTLGTDQPVWRYIDNAGLTQGPFPAKSMEEWFEAGFLKDASLRVCGTVRFYL